MEQTIDKCRINWISLQSGFEGHKGWVDANKRDELDVKIHELEHSHNGNAEFWVECV